MRKRLLFGLYVSLTVLLFPLLLHAEGVVPGDIVVADVGPGHGQESALVIIDPKTGKQRLLSIGNLLDIPRGMAFDRVGHRFLVVNFATLVAIDASTGAQSLVKRLPGLVDGIAVEAPQQYLLTDYNGRLLRYNENTNILSVLAEGRLIGEVAPWAVQVRQDGQIFVSSLMAGGLDAPGLPARVIQIDPSSGAQSLIIDSPDLTFRDFVILGDELLIGTEPRGGPFDSDTVSRLDIHTGLLTPVYLGLQRVLDVDQLTDGKFAVLDQILTVDDIRSPVVYKANKNHLTPLSTYGLMLIPSRSVVVQCFEDGDCNKNGGKAPRRYCNLQGTCKATGEPANE